MNSASLFFSGTPRKQKQKKKKGEGTVSRKALIIPNKTSVIEVA